MKDRVASRIDDIEALRAVAVLFTIFYHTSALIRWDIPSIDHVRRFLTFWTGVDLFFAISGFVIARDLLDKLDTNGFSERFCRVTLAFWIKRVYRILPTSFLWASITLLASVALRHTDLMHSVQANVADFAAVVAQVYNFHWSLCHEPYQCGDMGPWWSLSLEEQFYIVLPVAALVFRKRLPYVLVVIVIAQFFVHRTPATLLMFVRSDALCLGVLLAIFSRHPLYKIVEPTVLKRQRFALPIVALLVFLLAALPEDGPEKLVIVSFSTGLVALTSAALVFIASFNRDYIIRGAFAKAVFVWIGTRSYALYLIHVPAAFATRAFWRFVEPSGTVFGPRYNLRFLLVWAVTTVILVEFNYRFVEQPLRKRGRDVAKRVEIGATFESHRDVSQSSDPAVSSALKPSEN